MKVKKKIIERLKEYVPSMIVTVVIATLVFISQFPYFAGVISFVFVDCIIGYWYKNKVICDKAKINAQASNENKDLMFNSEYFDLYYEFNYNQMMFVLRAICLAFSLCPFLYNVIEDKIQCTIIGIAIAVAVFVASTIISSVGKRNSALLHLCNKRNNNWFGEYTNEELDILRKLKD